MGSVIHLPGAVVRLFLCLIWLALPAHAQDWGRHASSTFTPPPAYEWRSPAVSTTQSADAVRVAPKALHFGTTAKDIGGRLYLAPESGLLRPPPNVGENRR